MITRTARPTRMSAPDRRDQILDATQAIVDEQGFHALSIEAVARRAGISRPVVYEHFGDLAGLLEALTDRMAERAGAQLAAVLPADLDRDDPAGALLAAFRGYLEAARSDPATWRMVLMPPEGAPEIARERIAIGRNAVLAQLAEAIRPGLGSGQASPDPELTARMISTLADDAVRLALTDPEQYPVERLLSHAQWMLGQLEPPRPGAAKRAATRAGEPQRRATRRRTASRATGRRSGR
jgi:AcrR family transcriptional regulator